MKTALIATLILAFSSSSFAWVSHDAPGKEYIFKFNLAGQSKQIRKIASSYEDAYKEAAQECFNFYKGPGKVSEDKGLDIIDTCANPRS